jgi:hypothetical protein
MYQVRWRGVGDVVSDEQALPKPTDTSFLARNLETSAWCTGASYYIDPFCWGQSKDAWEQKGQYGSITTMPVSPAAIPSGYTTVAPTVDEAAQQTSDVLAAAMRQTQANNLAAAQNQPTVCDSGQVLADDGVTCVSPANWWLWGAVAAVSVFALVAISGGSPRRYGR